MFSSSILTVADAPRFAISKEFEPAAVLRGVTPESETVATTVGAAPCMVTNEEFSMDGRKITGSAFVV